jgi:ABC-type lipoprotein release transport system permease subunit
VAIASFTVFAGTVVPAWRAVRMTPMSVLRAE